MQHIHAELYHNATALRGINSPTDVQQMPDAQRQLAVRSIHVARKCLDITLTSPAYREGMKYGNVSQIAYFVTTRVQPGFVQLFITPTPLRRSLRRCCSDSRGCSPNNATSKRYGLRLKSSPACCLRYLANDTRSLSSSC